MSQLTLERWAREFRREAKTDKLAVLRAHLRRLHLQAKPERVLEGTIQAVQACSVLLYLDGQPYLPFLAMQTYDPARSPSARYSFTFDLCGKAFARVLVTRELRGLDLADLYGHPFYKYKVYGFWHFWILRVDRTALKKPELARLTRQVTDDLRFDYSEDELDFWFDDSNTAGALFVDVQDHEDGQEEQQSLTNNLCSK
jgi:hypothetical protein